MLVLGAPAIEQERDVPFALAAAVLGDAVLPAAATPVGPTERFRHHRALRTLLEDAAGGRPFALVLDDLHWADDASLEWLLYLLRRPPQARGALFLATRPGPVAPRIIDAVRDRGEALTLAPLSEDAASALLADLDVPAARPALVREAAGNPLFLRELARTAPGAGDAPPPSIVAAVQREAAALPVGARAMLAGAAVAGEPFDPALAAIAADGGEPAALDLLVAADLVRGDGRAFRFRHPLVGRAVYTVMAPGARAAAHARVAAELAVRGAPLALRAHHVERSATPGDAAAAALLARAAGETVDAAPATAARWWAAALELAGSEDPELVLARAQALAAAGAPEEALLAFDALARAAPAVAARAAASAARVERLLGRNAAARGRLERALAHAPPAQHGDLELELATAAFTLGDLRATLEHARRAAAARRGGDAAMRAILSVLDAFAATWSGDERTDPFAEPERLALGVPEADALEAGHWFGTLAFQCERYAQAARVLAHATGVSAARRADHILPQLRTLYALSLHFDLRPVAALEQADTAEEGARLQGVPMQVGFALSTRAIVLELLGRAGEAEAAAAESLEALAGAEPSLTTRIAATMDRAILHALDPPRLLAEVEALLDPAIVGVERPTSLLRVLVPAAIATGRTADAEAWVARAAAFTARVPLPAGRVRAAAARAELLLAAGEATAAHETATAAVARAEDAGLALDATRARVVAGRAAAAVQDRDAAHAALTRAHADAARAGADGLVAEAARALRAAGGRITAGTLRAGGTSGELSDRERRIAELVASGHSNKEVAATLYLSPKTVENNLSRIYAKLGVRTRTELAHVLRA